MKVIPSDCVHDASKLILVYGYWPTFHDAAVESVLIERVGPTVTIRFRLCDLAVRDDGIEREVRSEATLCWTDVSDVKLAGIDTNENNWIDSLAFEREGDLLRTTLRVMDGIHGFLLSRTVQVIDVAERPSAE